MTRPVASAGLADRLRLVAWTVGLGATLWSLHLVGPRAGLTLPSPVRPAGWAAWVDEVGAAVALAGVLRMLALGLAWYLVVVTIVVAAAHRPDERASDGAWTRLVPRFVRSMVGSAGLFTAASLTLTASPLLVPQASTATASAERSPATMADRTVETSAAPLTIVPLAAGETVDSDDPDPSPGQEPMTVEPWGFELAPLAEPEVASTWVVEPGDHLWHIAAETVGQRGDTVDDGSVHRYWLDLIERNRDRLVDPSNPDLIYPGQEFVLPDGHAGT